MFKIEFEFSQFVPIKAEVTNGIVKFPLVTSALFLCYKDLVATPSATAIVVFIFLFITAASAFTSTATAV